VKAIFIRVLRLTGFFSALLFTCAAVAQHTHGVLTPGVTFPQDDAVLLDPPQMITMSFRVDVQLLKLALYTADGEWVNIGFTYDPNRVSHSFVYPIPGEVPPSRFHVARWSVVDERRRILNGEFKFAFGPNAIPPSETIENETGLGIEVLPSTGAYRTGVGTNN